MISTLNHVRVAGTNQEEEIRDWYADSANHPPREYAGSGEMWKFISQKAGFVFEVCVGIIAGII